MIDKQSFKKGALAGVLAMCIIGAFLLLGLKFTDHWFAGGKKTTSDSASDVILEKETQKKLDKLDGLVDKYYLYGDEIDEDHQREGVYAGFINSLGDPYSVYYDQEATKALRETMSGEYDGIGAVLSQDEESGLVRVIKVYVDSPAQKAGLKRDDLIAKVDGKDVTDNDLNEVVTWIRGEKGTEVVLTIRRKDKSGAYQEMKLTALRSSIEVETVDSKMLEGKIGYISVSEFEQVSEDQFKEAVDKLNEAGAKGLIVDLRDNPGGDLDTVCAMLDYLLPKGTVVYTKDKNDKREDYSSDEEHKYARPVNVLANRYSASASEIFCGAIQDFGAGKIVGEKTYGKGVVQQIIDLRDGTCLKLTVAEYFTPKGRSINKKGVQPDVEVKSGTNDEYGDPARDQQLKKAIEELK